MASETRKCGLHQFSMLSYELELNRELLTKIITFYCFGGMGIMLLPTGKYDASLICTFDFGERILLVPTPNTIIIAIHASKVCWLWKRVSMMQRQHMLYEPTCYKLIQHMLKTLLTVRFRRAFKVIAY